MYIETHPFKEFIPKNTKSLIVGSFPPIKLTIKDIDDVDGENKDLYEKYLKANKKTEDDIDFYYGSKENLFWKLMGDVFDKNLNSVSTIKKFLEINLIGITDIIENCKRKSTKVNQKERKIDSSDKGLIIKEYRDVIKTIKENNIRKIYCTSKYVSKRLKERDSDKVLENREIVVLFSPSPVASIWISKLGDFINKKKNDPDYNTSKYRIEKYKEVFGIKP
ncbi:MAG: hypothetical protein KAT62_02140 [Desulfuromonadales bacterium]|nr:hypothetical protein [Desulfuromonadales bacterium]